MVHRRFRRSPRGGRRSEQWRHAHPRITRSIRRNAIVAMVGSLATFGFMGGTLIGVVIGEGMGAEELGAFVGIASGFLVMFWTTGRAFARRLHRRASERDGALARRSRRKCASAWNS